MPRLNSSSCLSRFKSGSGGGDPPRREKPQQLACDRCRGQKLRCIRSANPKSPCERCQKAGATCIIDTGVRMGRPRRTDKENSRESNGISRNPSQPKPSPPSPTPPSHSNKSVDFALDGDAWIVHNIDDTMVDPTLPNITVEYLDSFGFSPSGKSVLEDDTRTIPTEEYLNPIMNLSSGQPIPVLIEDEATAMDTTESTNEPGRFPTMRQEAMQELSDLNMQLSRQLSAVISMANRYTNIHPSMSLTSMVTPLDENRALCDAVVFMMHSLQTYHRLIAEMLGSPQTAHSSLVSSHARRNSNTLAANITNPIEGVHGEDLTGNTSEKTAWPWEKGFQSDDSVEFFMFPDSSPSANLDMPTSLLLLSCHTNLMHLCQHSFAAIRAALIDKQRQINLFAISFFNIIDFSIPSDPDLQIIVLIQAVVRMIEKIGCLLGCRATVTMIMAAKSPRVALVAMRFLDCSLTWCCEAKHVAKVRQTE